MFIATIAPKLALDPLGAVDGFAQLGDFRIGQLIDPSRKLDFHLGQDLFGRRPADAVDVGQGNAHRLAAWNVYAGDTRHS